MRADSAGHLSTVMSTGAVVEEISPSAERCREGSPSATSAACSFSPLVAESFALVDRVQAVEVAALQRLASPGGWLMTREVR